MAVTLTASIRKRAEQATLELPFPFPEKEWFSLRSAGAVLGICESVAEKLYDQGQLTGHSHNAGSGQRMHKRVLRVSLLAYAIRTKDYDDDSIGQALIGCLHRLPVETLHQLTEAAALLIEAKKISPMESRKVPRSASGR